MTMIPAFGPWTEHPADTDEEKRLASAQQSKTTPTSIDREHETGVFYGSGKDPYQTTLASCTCNDFVRRKKPCKHVFRLAMELGIIDTAYKTGRSTGERNEAQISFADSVALVEQLSDVAQNAIKDIPFLPVIPRRNERSSLQRPGVQPEHAAFFQSLPDHPPGAKILPASGGQCVLPAA